MNDKGTRIWFPCEEENYHARGVNLYGEPALVEMICHELAHHRTSGHAKGFKAKYQKFWNYMKNEILGGNYEVSAYDFKKLNDALEEQDSLCSFQRNKNLEDSTK